MDWIKKNYDRLLLAIFGLLALVVGSMMCLNAFSSAATPSGTKIKEGNKLPDVNTESLKQTAEAIEASKGKSIWASPQLGPHKKARLFTGPALVRQAGVSEAVDILDDNSPEIRSGVPNHWLHQYGLDLTRTDILSQDDDNDTFTNLEEYLAKTSPRDPQQMPSFYHKLELVAVQSDSYKMRANLGALPDIAIKRITPTIGTKQPGTLTGKLMDVLFEDDKRWTVAEVRKIPDPRNPSVQIDAVILKEAGTDKEVVLPDRQDVDVPTYKVKLVNRVDKEEVIAYEGKEIKFKYWPTIFIKCIKIDPVAKYMEAEFQEPGAKLSKFKLDLKDTGPAGAIVPGGTTSSSASPAPAAPATTPASPAETPGATAAPASAPPSAPAPDSPAPATPPAPTTP